MNPIELIDGYKIGHKDQYPKGTQRIYSNWTPRSSRIDGQKEVVTFGLQYFLKHYLKDIFQTFFFDKPRHEVEREYADRIKAYLNLQEFDTSHIGELHELGYLPLEFRALPEGTLCPLGVPMFTVENTDDRFFWLVNYIETLISNSIWIGSTSATSAYRLRKLLNTACLMTGGDPGFVQWQGHDFSMRGMAGLDAAILSGAGHLLSFTGTDTIPAIGFVEKYYPGENGLIGGSVPATEHSVMCAGGEETELETFNRLLDIYPTGVLSVVSDTWDLWKVITGILPRLVNKIMNRDGKVVIRPDSGDPVKIICGNPDGKSEAEIKGVVQLLWEIFGGTISSNSDGSFKHLDPHIGVIYGDAITYERAQAICEGLRQKGFASTNIVFGVGSYTYQYVTRDTYGFAMKATWARINDKEFNLFKKPVTDTGDKFSAKGRLAVLKNDEGKLYLVNEASEKDQLKSQLQLVWRNGTFTKAQSFKNVRETLWG